MICSTLFIIYFLWNQNIILSRRGVFDLTAVSLTQGTRCGGRRRVLTAILGPSLIRGREGVSALNRIPRVPRREILRAIAAAAAVITIPLPRTWGDAYR